jgi:hypothetical protein
MDLSTKGQRKTDEVNSVNQGALSKFLNTDKNDQKFPNKPHGYRKWNLSENASARCGLLDNEVVLRLSCEPVLTEDRPYSPSPFMHEYNPKMKNKVDDNGDELVAKTIFLSIEEFQEFERLINILCWYDYDSGYGKISSVNYLERPTAQEKKDREQYPCWVNTAPVISTSNFGEGGGGCIITTFIRKCGYNQMDQCAVESGSVRLNLKEFLQFVKYAKEIVTHMKAVIDSHAAVSKLVLKSAGETLSLMLRSKHGEFSKEEVKNYDPNLMRDLMKVYSEFMGMGYIGDLVKSVHSKAKHQNLDLEPDILLSLVFQILSQTHTLFSCKYITCPEQIDSQTDVFKTKTVTVTKLPKKQKRASSSDAYEIIMKKKSKNSKNLVE